MLAMISVSAGYGTDGSSTPMTVAVAITDAAEANGFADHIGSFLKTVDQKR